MELLEFLQEPLGISLVVFFNSILSEIPSGTSDIISGILQRIIIGIPPGIPSGIYQESILEFFQDFLLGLFQEYSF